jgi:hypothetical protein
MFGEVTIGVMMWRQAGHNFYNPEDKGMTFRNADFN